MRVLLVCALLTLVLAAPAADLMTSVPGYPSNFPTRVFSGYLDLKSTLRGAHYVFVESVNGVNNKDPITLWLNGGPGCSSLLGFIQEIGPYILPDGRDYSRGGKLIENNASWHKASNLLFIESPSVVGFSYNNDPKFYFNDQSTANDNMNALLDFFKKFPEYARSRFWIAGESYAGKYIPDLAVLIDSFNDNASPSDKIDFRGMLVGNGVMTFETLAKSQVQFLIDREFADPDTIVLWKQACQTDEDSAGCRFFKKKLDEATVELNPYSVYDYCYYNSSDKLHSKSTQQSILLNLAQKMQPNPPQSIVVEQAKLPEDTETIQTAPRQTQKPKFNGAPCAYFTGMFNYFNLNSAAWHPKTTDQPWKGPCVDDLQYDADPAGSLASYRRLLGRFDRKYSIVLYSGSWDAVVPYVDTIKGIKMLNLVESYLYTPWFTNNQHSGFEQLFSGLLFVLVKGASHQVPQSKRDESYNLFKLTIEGHQLEDTYNKLKDRNNMQYLYTSYSEK